MSTPPAPARLWILFASQASVAVVMRRGPSQWMQLILWHTDTDTFVPGQWLRGKIIYASLNPDGKHMAMGIMANKHRRDAPLDSLEYTLVSRPPFFTALAISLYTLRKNYVRFTDGGAFEFSSADKIQWRATDLCPYPVYSPERSDIGDLYLYDQRRDHISPEGRQIQINEGRIFDVTRDEPRLLFDANPYQPTPVETPEWAKSWNDEPPTIPSAS